MQNVQELRHAVGDFDLQPQRRLQLPQDVLDPAAGQQPALLQDANRRTKVGHLGKDVAGDEDGPPHGV